MGEEEYNMTRFRALYRRPAVGKPDALRATQRIRELQRGSVQAPRHAQECFSGCCWSRADRASRIQP